jgi:pilus assembly protein CpaB
MKQKIMMVWAIIFGILTSISFYMVIHEKKSQSKPAVSAQLKQQPVKKNSATVADQNSGLAIQPGKRAMSIPVNEYEGVSGFIQAGSHVDVNVIVKAVSDHPDWDNNLSAHVLLQNIKVLATGVKKAPPNSSDNKAKDNSANTATPNNPDIYHEVVLEVTPAEGLALTLASKKGTVYLTLRAPNDSLKVGHTGLTLDDVSKGEIGYEHQVAK